MPTMSYNPDQAPDPREWLALDHLARHRLATAYHEKARIKTPKPNEHGVFHIIVETQIAKRFEPTCRAMERLQRQGLSRHESIHAIAAAIHEFASEIKEARSPENMLIVNSRMSAGIERVTAANWKASAKGR